MVVPCGAVLHTPAGGTGNAILMQLAIQTRKEKCCKCLLPCGKPADIPVGSGEKFIAANLHFCNNLRSVGFDSLGFEPDQPLASSNYAEFCSWRVWFHSLDLLGSPLGGTTLAHFSLRPNLVVLGCAGRAWRNRV